ncbi:hypothetical protein DPEC_G00179040 [Dallia pectoralis]|uniref:Uncharacterized protein n=1 Tax=Dallia pectoralis TaxID=75939 RepID=A0ACC2GFG3_DALPE|nr:hypothetical protein DPEC_G00179040 [Dallia pectoralis]
MLVTTRALASPTIFPTTLVSGTSQTSVPTEITAPATTSMSPDTVISTSSGILIVNITLVFNLDTLVPTSQDILPIVNKELRTQFRIFTQTTFQNATYIKIAETSYAIELAFQINNISIEEILSRSNAITFTSKTYNQTQDLINSLLRGIICQTDNKQFPIPEAKFIAASNTQINANLTYVYNKADTDLPSAFLTEILRASGLLTTTAAPTTTTSTTLLPSLLPTTAAPTTTTSTTLLPSLLTTTAAPTTTTSTTLLPSLLLSTFYSTTSGGGFPGWALAIIIPCGIAIILIPLWILLACLLCGCCAGIRRRWHRRRSYNVEHTTTYGLF